MKLDKTTRQNLQIALEKLPDVIKGFDMSSYGCMDAMSETSECGTIGCLLGWCALVFELEESDLYKGKFCYMTFCPRVFPSLYKYTAVNNFWKFLFSADWVLFDNTKEGALARIKYLLDRNLSDNFRFMYQDFKEGWHLKATAMD